jgi:lambda family phage portal protein
MAPKVPKGIRNRFLNVVDQYGRPIPVSALSGHYEGAGFGRRLSTWGTSSAGPNTSLYSSLATLRARSRELVRNHPLPDGAIDSFVANLIGTGITPRWQIEDKVLKKDVQQLWDDWTVEADADGTSSFYGLQALIARAMIEGGEALVRLRNRRPVDMLSVPLQLQGMEGDHLDETYNTIADNGNPIRMGIEFSRNGRRIAYWLFRDHPGESFMGASMERVRVPASQVIHVFKPLRLGQIRGRPWMSSIIVRLHELDQYEDAELVRKKTAAMFGGFITEPPGEDTGISPLGTPSTDSDNREVVALEPGTFPVLPPGMDVKFAEPADVGGNFDSWIKQQLREIARGMGVTYEQLTGDLEGVNYSSIRAGLLEFRRLCRQIQAHILVHQFCRPVAQYWMDLAVLSGALRISDYWENRRKYQRIKWRPDGWDWVDPVKDQLAEKMSVRSGFKSRAQVVAERGQDIETVDAEIAEDNARADELGLVFDTDPRKTAGSGAIQAAEDAMYAEAGETGSGDAAGKGNGKGDDQWPSNITPN